MTFKNNERGSVIPNMGELRQQRVAHARARLLDVATRLQVDTIVLSSPSSVAWATGAISTPIDRVAPTDPVWVVATPSATTLVVSSVEAERLEHDCPLDELGFAVMAAPWWEPGSQQRLASSLVRGRVATDVAGWGVDATLALISARLALGAAEQHCLTTLAAVATEAVEEAVRGWQPGKSRDREIAAAVVGPLERAGADAVCLIVGGDERLARFRHPMMCGDVINDSLMVVVVARAFGLHVALTRLATANGDVPRPQLDACAEVQDYVHRALVPGATWGDVYEALGRGYAAVGQPDAWREHFQGGPIGYGQREFELHPEATLSPWWHEPVPEGCAVAFNPSIAGGAKIEDTFLVGATPTCLTASTWPRWGATLSPGVLDLSERRAS